MKAILSTIIYQTSKAVYYIERAIFFRTGLKLRFLAYVWYNSGERIQKRLNRQNGTDIQYGYIKEN